MGTWGEEEEDVSDEALGINTDRAEGEGSCPPELGYQVSNSDSSISVPNSTFGPIPIERQTRSEPLQTSLPTSLVTSETGASAQSSHPHPRPRHTMYSSGTLLSPPSFRTRFIQRRPTMTADTQRFSSSSHQRATSHPSNAFSPPLNTTVSTLGTGLQIGLSPVSPGFAIVPKERRRKLSGLGVGDIEQRFRSHERSVSEGDVRGSLGICGGPGPGTIPTEQIVTESSEDVGRGRGLEKRWRWLRDVLFKRK